MPIDGGGPVRVAEPFTASGMVSPDGRRLACNYITTSEPPKRLTDFKSEEVFDFDASRGGDLAFSRSVVMSDAVIIKHVN